MEAREETAVAISLRDSVVRAARVAALEAVGFRVVADPSKAQVCVVDEEIAQPAPTALVVPATPAACAGSLKAVLAGRARGAATDADMELLPTVVRSVAHGVLCITPRVIDLAEELPVLTARELAVLRLAAQGIPLSQVGRRLHVSHATVKRELATLFAAFAVRSRGELVLAA